MKLRTLGRSELQITPVILGTWALGGWLWGGTEKNKPRETIIASLDAGINCIDTAPVYGFGLSEEVVGNAIKGNRENFVIATKCGLVWDSRQGSTFFFETEDSSGQKLVVSTCLRKHSILNECDKSLKLLGIDEIDLYQCHWPDPGTPIDETIEALIELKDKGKIREFGVSNFSAEQVDEMVKKGVAPVSNQLKYSFLSRETAEKDIPYCIDNNIGVICYSPMEMGLLAGKIGLDTVFPENDTRCARPWFELENRRKALAALDSLQPLVDKYNATLGQLIIAATIELPGISGAIAGARNPDQASSNARAGILELEKEDVNLIIETFEPLNLEKTFDPATAKR
jgi:aryl-alcohol dehydrogenase-like predicted oxidoreductase